MMKSRRSRPLPASLGVGLLAAIATIGPAHAELGCAPGVAADLTPLVNAIEAMPEGGWMRANDDRYDSVWTPPELRPSSGALLSTPSKIIQAWSSFAWDCRRGAVMLYGGGHANYSGNDTYRWRATTRRWERMSLPSDITVDGMGNTTAIDGPFAAPPAAHTYDNNVYLPVIDRFLVLGGSAWNNGGAYEIQTGPDSERITGPYFFDPGKADGSKVGGTTGSHVKREAPFPEILGGMMWQNRDLYALLPATSLPSNHTSGSTAYAGSTTRDAVLVTARAGLGTGQNLYRYEFPDPSDASQDRVTRVGRFMSGVTGRGAGTFDPDLNAFVRTAIGSTSAVFYFWDLAKAGPDNPNVTFIPRDLSGGWQLNRGYGLDFDPVRGQYLLWDGNADVWILRAPATATASGWTIERAPPPPSGAVPVSDYSGTGWQAGGGVLGKWKYIPELDAFIGLQDTAAGNIWIYKPVGWTRPGVPRRPTLNISVSREQVFAGDNVTVTWRSRAATSCVALGGWTSATGTAGSQVINSVTADTTFSLRCDGPGGSITRSVSVAVDPIGPPTIDAVSGDGCVNAPESAAGVVVSGGGTRGATVVVTLGSISREVMVNASGLWSLTLTSADLAGLAQGSHSLSARQRNAGNALSDPVTRTFVKDTIAPVQAATAPRVVASSDTGASSSDGITRDTTPQLTGSSAAPSARVALLVNGSARAFAKTDASGQWTAGLGVMSQGTYAVAAAVADSCANLGPGSAAIGLTIDTSAPPVTVAAIAGDNRINATEATTSLAVSGTAEPGATIGMQISFAGSSLVTRSTSTDGAWSFPLAPADIAGLPEGTITVVVTGTDVAGNRRSVARSLVKDTQALPPSMDPVTGDDTLTAAERSAPVSLTGSAEAAATVTVLVGGWTRQTKADASGRWATTMPAATAAALPIGNVTFSARLIDRVGNASGTTLRQVRVLGPN